MQKLGFFALFIFTGIFLIPIPIYKEVYLYEPETTYIISTGLGMAISHDLEDATNISLSLTVSSETNFCVIIDYCAFEESDYLEERDLTDLVISGSEGHYNFFVLLVKDTTILSKINSSVGLNRVEPNLTTHFEFNCSLEDGTPKVWMGVHAGYYSGINFHSGLIVSYTYYEYKIRNWVWISSAAVFVAFLSFIIPYLVIKKKKN